MNAMKALARDLLREVQTVDDYQTAKALLLEKISTDQHLRSVAIDYAVETFLSNEWRAGRSARWSATAEAAEAAEARSEPAFGGGLRPALPARSKASFVLRRKFADVVLKAKETLLMEWELGPGIRMKDATRDVLLKHAGINESQAAPMLERARWYREVSALLPNGRARVGDVLREADLKRAEKKAKG